MKKYSVPIIRAIVFITIGFLIGHFFVFRSERIIRYIKIEKNAYKEGREDAEKFMTKIMIQDIKENRDDSITKGH